MTTTINMIAHEHTQHFLLLQRRLHFPQSKDGSTTWEPFYSEAGPFAEKNNHCFTGVGMKCARKQRTMMVGTSYAREENGEKSDP
jgi:hypothetical protein